MARATKRDITAFQNHVESKISSTAIAALKDDADKLMKDFVRLRSEFAELSEKMDKLKKAQS